MAVNSGPASDVIAVTPSDSTTIGGCRGLWVGTAGDLTVDTPNHSNVVIKNVANGTLVPVAVLRVKAATTASDIVALY